MKPPAQPGQVIHHPLPEAPAFNLEAIRSRLPEEKPGEQCYALFQSIGLSYVPSFQGIQALYHSDTEALSRVSLPLAVGFVLSPGLLDSALQTCIGLGFGQDSISLQLPFSVREVNIYGELEENLWAYARGSAPLTTGPARLAAGYDIDLISDSGKTLISFRGLATMPLHKPGEGVEEQATLQLYELSWRESPLKERAAPESSGGGQLVLLAGGSASLADKLREVLEVEVSVLEPGAEEGQFIETFRLVKEMLQAGPATHITILCRHSEWRDYGFLVSLLKTTNLENPKLSGKVVGVDSLSIKHLEELTEIIEREQASEEVEVRYVEGKREVKVIRPLPGLPRGSERVALARQPSTVYRPPSAVKEKGIYLITGGAGGLGLIFARYISSAAPGARLILTGRSELGEGIQARIADIPGAEYRRCDITQQAEVNELVAAIKQRYGQLDGIIHSAGVIRDSFIIKKTRKKPARCWRPRSPG
ncbi:MAG: SDR family NAD(P)-dependent oxidoreductase [Lewinellaceae bacterium]|nr:SDR family NAD(P)-dependent oxidoreductase [Lewinellaceae bacterium]